jgi:hypothetical protein
MTNLTENLNKTHVSYPKVGTTKDKVQIYIYESFFIKTIFLNKQINESYMSHIPGTYIYV